MAQRDRLRVTIAFRGGDTRVWVMSPGQYATTLDAITRSEVGWALIEGAAQGGEGRASLAVNRTQVLYVHATSDGGDG